VVDALKWHRNAFDEGVRYHEPSAISAREHDQLNHAAVRRLLAIISLSPAPHASILQSGESSRLSGSPGSKPPPDVGKRQKKKRVFFFRRTLDFARVLDGPDSVLEFVVGWGQSKVLLAQSPQL
jgi:hypothetical protein